MSQFLVGAPTVEIDGPLRREHLVQTFHHYGTPRAEWRVGGEYERAVVRGDGAAVTFDDPDGIEWILGQLKGRTGWRPHDEAGRLIALEGEGASITLEPGGQVELSGAPFHHLADLDAEVRRNRDHLVALSDGHDHHWIAAGLTPYAPIDGIPWVPKGRYRIMREYLPRYGPLAHWMMKGTCSVQANFDYADEADCARKFEVAQALAPLNTAIFANSPVAEGRDTGFVSYRGFVWTRTDPARTGFPPTVRAGYTHERWVDYLLDTPMMFVQPRGEWVSAEGRTFRQWMEQGIDGIFPTLRDWSLHQTSVFPEVRVKKTIEIRGADAVSLPLAVGFCALWKGVLYGPAALDAALALSRRFVATEEPHEARHLASAHDGLEGRMSGRPTAEWARELGGIARAGLVEQGEDPRFLDPVLALLESGRSPGAAVREAFRRDPAPANVLPVLAY